MNIQNSMMVLTFSFFIGNTLLGQICSKKTKMFIRAEIWCSDNSENAKFNGHAQFFFLRTEILFMGKFGPKIQNYFFRMKCGT